MIVVVVVEMKEELVVVKVLMEKMKREEGEKGFIFGIEFEGDEKRCNKRWWW